MKFIIDRFEGNYAIIELEDLEYIEIPIRILPKEAREGDVLYVAIDNEETKKRKKRIGEKFNRLIAED